MNEVCPKCGATEFEYMGNGVYRCKCGQEIEVKVTVAEGADADS